MVHLQSKFTKLGAHQLSRIVAFVLPVPNSCRNRVVSKQATLTYYSQQAPTIIPNTPLPMYMYNTLSTFPREAISLYNTRN